MTAANETNSPWMDLRSCHLDGIKVSETLVSAGTELAAHSHETGQICLVLEGEMRERAGGRDDHLRPGMLRSQAPGFQHTVSAAPESDLLTLLLFIDHDRWIPIESAAPRTAQVVFYADQIRRELGCADDASRLALEGWTMLALSSAVRTRALAPTASPPWLGDAVALIERRACEPISLTVLATVLGVHRATLAAAFRRFLDTSVGESIREVRVRRVIRALTGTRAPLCEIATKCGFHDQAHMGRVFRKATGFSPGAYRARH